MSADDLLTPVALGSLRPGVPVDDVALRIEHVDRVVGNALHEKPEAALRVFERAETLRKLRRALLGALLECFVQSLELFLRLPSRLDLPLARLIKARVVDGDRCLSGKGRDDALRALGKNMRLGVPEEEPPEHFS